MVINDYNLLDRFIIICKFKLGWLIGFKNRNSLIEHTISGERASVYMSVVDR